MGKIVLVALVGVWLFNLVRLIAGGLPGQATPQADAAMTPPAATASELAVAAETLPQGVALAIRSASVTHGAQSTISVGLTLAEPAIVDLDVYDTTGRCILTQSSRRLPAGRSSIQLQSIERLQPGHYWVRARVGDQIATASVAIPG